MVGEEDNNKPSGSNRRAYLRSVSWSEGSPSNSNSKPQFNSKVRACLPPLQPLAISRPRAQEWPRAGSDDLGVWPHNPSTPRVPTAEPAGNSGKPPREFEFRKDKLAFFQKECSKVADHVYLGSDAVAKNREILRQNNITHVLNCVGFVCPEYFKNDLVYKTLWLRDSPSEDITSILYDVFDYFEDVREQSGRVLVHCCQGVSRSTSLVIAYLMWRESRSFEDALQHVKSARGVTNPNMGFACQLLQCQKRVHLVPTSPNSMVRIFRMAPHSPYDPLHLVPKILNQPSSNSLDSRGAFILHVPSAIYIWIGKDCTSIMSDNARAAAFQVIRYEQATGPVLNVKEGEEPAEFWVCLGDDQPNVGKRKVDEYDLDFEMFSKAVGGGVVPPFAMSGNGSETCLPVRVNGWGRLRRKFATGIMKEFFTTARLSEIAEDITMDSIPEEDSPLSPMADDPSSPYSSSSVSPVWIKNDCKDADNSVALSLSPTNTFSSSYSLSRFLVNNPHSSSTSPSLSPSTSDYSNSFTFSPSSSNWSDLSYISAQPSPSGLDPKEPIPSKGKNQVSFSSETAPGESFSVLRNNFVRGTSPSIAERRGTPRMMLPSVDDSADENLVRSWSFSLADIEDDLMRKIECDGLKREGTNEGALMEDDYDHVLSSKSTVYRWPSLDEVETLSFDILDSRSVYIVFVSDTSIGPSRSDVLYIWLGHDVLDKKLQWEIIGHDVLIQKGLAANSTIEIVREGKEPECLLKHLNCFSFQKTFDDFN